MKTLKKTLCLVLAVVMVLGLGVMSASAKLDNYPDKEDITYAEAVDVMSGIGVLVGNTDGQFHPTDNVTRAQAAKILTYLMIGDAAKADALKTTTAPFTDVPATHWAAGYIAYCAQKGIIQGVGNGAYNPGGNVTGLQFAKMLLGALGYGVNGEYAGSEWSINVSKDAMSGEIGLFNGNLGGATNTAATREECALYAFNALMVDKVSYSALLGGYVSDDAFSGTGAVNPNAKQTIAADFELDRAKTDADAFGRPGGHHWYQGKTTNIISADYGSSKDGYGDVEDLQASYTTGVTGADIYNLLGKTFIDGAYNINDSVVKGELELFVNGVDMSGQLRDPYDPDDPGKITLKGFFKDNTEILEYTGNGVQTNVYAWSKGSKPTTNCLTITIVDTYIAKVVDVKAGTATKDPVTTIEYFEDVAGSNDNATAQFGMTPNASVNKFNTDEFKEGDYVLMNVTNPGSAALGKIRSMTPAVVKEGTITRYTRTKAEASVVSGGTTYIAAKNAAAFPTDKLYAADDDSTGAVNRAIVDGKDHVLYVDEYGYLLAVGKVAEESNYVYVAKFGWKADDSDELSDSNVLTAAVYYADGSHKVITVDHKAGIFDSTKGGTNVNSVDDTTVGDLNKDNGAGKKNMIYKLTMKKGKAILESAVTGEIETVSGSSAKVTKGVSTIDGKKADSKTVFFYVKHGDDYGKPNNEFAVEAFIGINSVPVADKTNNTTACRSIIKGLTSDDSTKAYAVLVDDSRESGSDDTVYLYTGEYYVDEDNWTVGYDVYINGKLDVLTISYKDAEEKDDAVADANTNFVNKFFTLGAKNAFTQAKLNAGANVSTGVASNNSTLKALNSVYYTTADVTIQTMDDKEASMTFTGITDKDSNTIAAECAYGYSVKGVIDLAHKPDEDGYISNIRDLEKYMNPAAPATTPTDCKVVVQFADNASYAIEYIYIVPNT